MTNPGRAIIETNLFRAHKAVVKAKEEADLCNDFPLWSDLDAIEQILVRLANASINGKRRTVIHGQLELVTRSPRGS